MRYLTCIGVLACMSGLVLSKFDAAKLLRADEECLSSVPLGWKKTTKMTKAIIKAPVHKSHSIGEPPVDSCKTWQEGYCSITECRYPDYTHQPEFWAEIHET